jgi:hypothetical protein
VKEPLLAAAIALNSALGPGLLDGAHKGCLQYELPKHGILVHRQEPIPIRDDNTDRASCWLATRHD